MLLFDDDLLDNETDVIKPDGKRSIIYRVSQNYPNILF